MKMAWAFSVLAMLLCTTAMALDEPTVYPVISTQCPVVHTSCPALPTMCGGTLTQCATEPTYCHFVDTRCPKFLRTARISQRSASP